MPPWSPSCAACSRSSAGGKPVTAQFPRIPYDEAIAKYGSDKPDLRNPIEMQDVTEHFRGSGFKVFAGMIEKDPKARVWAIPAPGGGSRAFCDRMNGWAQQRGPAGPRLHLLAQRPRRSSPIPRTIDKAGKTPETVRSIAGAFCEAAGPIAKNLGPERSEKLRDQLSVGDGDAVFFAAGNPDKFYKFAGEARTIIGRELKLVDENQFAFCWIVDFPMYEWNEEEKKIDFSHNPFSMPQGGLAALEAAKSTEDLLELKAYQYDIVCNGLELSSGAIRNHLPEIMVKAFGIAGYDQSVLEAKFGGM